MSAKARPGILAFTFVVLCGMMDCQKKAERTADMRKIIQTILQASDSGSLTKIIFAGKRKKSLEYSKITLRPVTIRGEYMYQAEFHFEKKVTHQNIPYHEDDRLRQPVDL